MHRAVRLLGTVMSIESSPRLHTIVVADAHDTVCVYGSQLLHSALDAAGLSSTWLVTSAVDGARLRDEDHSQLPPHVRSVSPRAVVATPDHLAAADLLVGFANMRWPVVDHVRALHCTAPAVALCNFVAEADAILGGKVLANDVVEAAMRHALTKPSMTCESCQHPISSDEFWTNVADVCAQFATLVMRVAS